MSASALTKQTRQSLKEAVVYRQYVVLGHNGHQYPEWQTKYEYDVVVVGEVFCRAGPAGTQTCSVRFPDEEQLRDHVRTSHRPLGSIHGSVLSLSDLQACYKSLVEHANAVPLDLEVAGRIKQHTSLDGSDEDPERPEMSSLTANSEEAQADSVEGENKSEQGDTGPEDEQSDYEEAEANSELDEAESLAVSVRFHRASHEGSGVGDSASNPVDLTLLDESPVDKKKPLLQRESVERVGTSPSPQTVVGQQLIGPPQLGCDAGRIAVYYKLSIPSITRLL